VLKQVQKESGKTPRALKNRPTLKQQDGYYMRAFDAVKHARDTSGEVPGAIPVSEVLAYFEMEQINDLDLRGRVFRHIRRLDEELLQFLMKRHKQKMEAAKAKHR